MINDSFEKRKYILSLVRKGIICFAGNSKLKIYGTLHCKIGKRMKPGNRVFFKSEKEAVDLSFRPCGYCMNAAYKKWKQQQR